LIRGLYHFKQKRPQGNKNQCRKCKTFDLRELFASITYASGTPS
jgi:hypothetical protein